MYILLCAMKRNHAEPRGFFVALVGALVLGIGVKRVLNVSIHNKGENVHEAAAQKICVSLRQQNAKLLQIQQPIAI